MAIRKLRIFKGQSLADALDSNVEYRYASRWPRRIAVAAAGAIAVCGTWYLFSYGSTGFPQLPGGGYVGQITGVFEPKDTPVTVYVESVARKNALLVVAFREGWQPQFLTLAQSNDANCVAPETADAPAPSADATCSFKPVALPVGAETFLLTGKLNGNRAEGKVLQVNPSSGESKPPQERTSGSWWLTATGTEDLRKDQVDLPQSVDLPRWLKLQAQHRQRVAELQKLTEEVSKEGSRAQTVTALTDTDSPVSKAAVSYRDELLAKNQTLRARLVEKTSQIATAVAEVQQLQRITRLGRTIDLARRVSTREDKWYQVNWQQEGDTAGIEEGLAQSMNVDLERLNKSYSKAQEIRNLRARIAEERERVAELTRRYQEKLAPQRPQGEESGPKEERPWWQRWNIVR